MNPLVFHYTFSCLLIGMYIPYLEKYIDNIIDIKKCAEKVAELNGFKTLDELDAVLCFSSL